MTTTAAIRYSHTVGSLSNEGRGFQNPVDVALDSQGVMYVLNRAGPELPLRLTYKRSVNVHWSMRSSWASSALEAQGLANSGGPAHWRSTATTGSMLRTRP